jgi:tol-pal system protein YbgF
MRQLGLVLLVSSLVSACAVSPEEDPVQIKLKELDGRLQRIERANQSVVDMAQKLEATQADMRRLRGRIDELNNENDTLRKRQQELYSDLDKRLAAFGTGAAAGGVVGASMGGGGAAAEQAAYTQAFDALKASNYAGAISGFSSFLSAYPSSPLAENAQYWLGEAHYAKGEYEQAASSFRVVGERWPTSRKAPDALLKLGYAQVELKQVGQARVTLSDVTRKFPDSDAARLAAERLSKLPGR